jgi:hypothetical protein
MAKEIGEHMKTIDQIAAEAAEMIRSLKYPNLEGIIKSACDKALTE